MIRFALSLALLTPSLAFAQSRVAGPFPGIDVPAGFTITGREFLDTDPATPGVQVSVEVSQGIPGDPTVVQFRTRDAIRTSDGAQVYVGLGRTNGSASAGQAIGGKVYATGNDLANYPVIWTPAFNAGATKLVTTYGYDATDSDHDGVTDADELLIFGTDPFSSDTDGDFLADNEELYWYGTDPLAFDTDGGGVGDGAELDQGSNPHDETDDLFPHARDFDGDGITDWDEYWIFGTNPNRDDTDRDGIPDGVEVYYLGSSATNADSDGGGENDGQEVAQGSNPFDPLDDGAPANADRDLDGISDRNEVRVFGTNPRRADTDGDGLMDGFEIHVLGTNALVRDTDGGGQDDGDELGSGGNPHDASDDFAPHNVDTDHDGIDDWNEVYISFTDRYNADSDFDGVLDGPEFYGGTNALNPDTDGGGLGDGMEYAEGKNPWWSGDDAL